MVELSHSSEISPSLVTPLTIERDGIPTAIIGITDLDGTAFDETIPEKDRKNTLAPARETVQALEAAHIPTGIGTSRSTGEALYFQELLGGNGIVFSEDGAAISLPPESFSQAQLENIQQDARVADITQLHGRHIIRLSKVSLITIDNFLQHVKTEVKKQDPSQELVSTRTSTTKRLMEVANHETEEAAALSAQRIASAYVASPTLLQRAIIERDAPSWGIRAHGDHINLIGADANKAAAMRFILDNIAHFFPHAQNIQRALPIFFGNGPNDIPFLEQAEDMGGIGVLVAHPSGGYFVDESKIPASVLKTTKPFGHGMKEALPEIANRLNSLYNTTITFNE